MKPEHAECLLQNAGINFFGTVVAVTTHELKNVLAIINENKGLLEDFAHLARQEERELEPDTALTTAAAISRQVERADMIVKNLNRFAHSPDQEVKSVDLGEIVALAAALARRPAAARALTLREAEKPGPVPLATAPFMLLHLLWRGLEFAFQVAAAGSELSWRVSAGPGGGEEQDRERGAGLIVLTWQPADAGAENLPAPFPGGLEEALLAALRGVCRLDSAAGRLELSLQDLSGV
jgi:hypothetical protein